MPKVTLYVKDSDLPLIKKAKKKLGESLSVVFTDCVRDRLESLDAHETTMQKIRLTLWDDNNQPVITKSFVGRWLVGGGPELGSRTAEDHWDGGAEWSIAQTKNRRIVAYVEHCNDRWAPRMEVFHSFEKFKEAKYPSDIIAVAADALGVPYEIEMDI